MVSVESRPLRRPSELERVRVLGADEGEPVRNQLFAEGGLDGVEAGEDGTAIGPAVSSRC